MSQLVAFRSTKGTTVNVPNQAVRSSFTSVDVERLQRCVELARIARERGDHPFGALLVSADGRLIEAMNTVNSGLDPTGHAETNLVKEACKRLNAATLSESTLYTSAEPCVKCAGAIYWAGITHVIFALSLKPS